MSTKKEEQLTHYRAVYKSDHLGVADLEEMRETGHGKFLFIIDHVKQEKQVAVAGKKGDHNIAYFKQPKGQTIKPWVLNAGNAAIVRGFAKSPFVEKWKNVPIELYIDENVKFGRDTVAGVRIKLVQPKLEKKKPVFKMDNFEDAASKGATIELIEKHYVLNPSTKDKYLTYLKSLENEQK